MNDFLELCDQTDAAKNDDQPLKTWILCSEELFDQTCNEITGQIALRNRLAEVRKWVTQRLPLHSFTTPTTLLNARHEHNYRYILRYRPWLCYRYLFCEYFSIDFAANAQGVLMHLFSLRCSLFFFIFLT